MLFCTAAISRSWAAAAASAGKHVPHSTHGTSLTDGRPGPERHSEAAPLPPADGHARVAEAVRGPQAGQYPPLLVAMGTHCRWQHISTGNQEAAGPSLFSARHLQLPGPPKPEARRGRGVIWAPNADAPQHPLLFNRPRDGALGGAGLDSILYKKTRKRLMRDRGRRGCLRRALFLGKCSHSPVPPSPSLPLGKSTDAP